MGNRLFSRITELTRDLFEQKKWHYARMFALVRLIRYAHRELQMFAVWLILRPGWWHQPCKNINRLLFKVSGRNQPPELIKTDENFMDSRFLMETLSSQRTCLSRGCLYSCGLPKTQNTSPSLGDMNLFNKTEWILMMCLMCLQHQADKVLWLYIHNTRTFFGISTMVTPHVLLNTQPW